MITEKKIEAFDLIVIGDNWTGWPLALVLSKRGLNVALIASQRAWVSPFPSSSLGSSHVMDIYPDTDSARKSLQWLSELIGVEVDLSLVETQRLIWDRGQWVPFVGFAESQASSVAYLSNLNKSPIISVGQFIDSWKQKMKEQFTGTYLDQAELTGMDYNEGRVDSIVINGNRRLRAHSYIYCDSPKSLLKQLPKDCFKGHSQQKIAKSQTMTCLTLNWFLETSDGVERVEQEKDLYFFLGAKNYEPFVGRFWGDGQGWGVSWQSLVPDKLAESPESLGSQLRYMKRQLKRPFIKWFEQPMEEKIVVDTESHGYVDLRHQLTQFKNLWHSSSLLQESDGVIGGLEAAQSVYGEVSAHFPTS